MTRIRNWFNCIEYIEEYNPNDNNYIESCGLHESEYIRLKEYEGQGDGGGVHMDVYNMLSHCLQCGSILESKFGFCVDRYGRYYR